MSTVLLVVVCGCLCLLLFVGIAAFVITSNEGLDLGTLGGQVTLPPGSPSGPSGPPSPPFNAGGGQPGPVIPVKTGNLASDVHVLEEKDAVKVDIEGFEVWTPKEIVQSDETVGGKGRVVLKDYMRYMFRNGNCKTITTTPGYVIKEWDTSSFWPDWAGEDYARDWPRGKKFTFTCLWVRVHGTWFVIPRRDFLGEKAAHDRLIASARVLSVFYEGMKPVLETMIRDRDKIRPEFRLRDDEVERAKELISGKTSWIAENLPTEWFALGGGYDWRRNDKNVEEKMINGSKHGFAYDLVTKDPLEYARSIFGIAVHEDCHCLCGTPDCSDDCVPGHSSRFQQLEFICINFLQNSSVQGRKKGDVHPCHIDSSKCNPQPSWLPVKNNANGGSGCNVDPNTFSTDLNLYL
jgi:hypothetical protein